MSDHPINGLMDTTLRKIKELVDVNTIIGDPITTPDGTTVIPISKVSYGFASGGSDLPTKKDNRECFGGGTGAGVTINPIVFLSISDGNVRLIPVEAHDTAADRIVDAVPDVIDKVASFFKKDKKKDKTDLENDIPDFDI